MTGRVQRSPDRVGREGIGPAGPGRGDEPRLGILDWGIGGIGLVSMLDRLLPGLPVVYWSDTAAPPYGLLSTGVLVDRLRSVVDDLATRGCTEVVLACNAASTVVDALGASAIPVEGIIGHGVAEVPADLSGVIGVVGGRRTIRAGGYHRRLAGSGRTIRGRVAQPLSAHIEAGRTGSEAFVSDLRRIVAPLHGAAAVVLACTHYPAATPWFARELPGTLLVDPAAGLAGALVRRHAPAGSGPVPACRTSAAGRSGSPGQRTFLTTGDPGAMVAAARAAWGVALPRPQRVVLRPR